MVPSNADGQRENGMAGVSAPLSIEAFRAWVEMRPDNEHWELIAGVPMMMAPPTKAHQQIAGNLDQMLRVTLEQHRPEWSSYQRVGLNVAPVAPDYDPEPDVVVIDTNAPDDERYFDHFYLAAEVVSASDRKTVESKRDVYKRHPDCRCVLIIDRKRLDVRLALLTDTGWTERHLARPDDELVLEDFDLRCRLADLYRGTSLHPRAKR
jgi:Uma2 family endonuclease